MPRWSASLAGAAFAAAVAHADSRFEVATPATVSFFAAHAPRAGANLDDRVAGPSFRVNLYPTVKMGAHWFGYGAIQVHSRPYFFEEFPGRGARDIRHSILQAYVGYHREADGRSITFRLGQLTSAFGSFPLRYDDARNWTIDLPIGYGYYYTPVSVYGMPGAEVDVTLGKVDARVQLTNSFPSNVRGWDDSDQYANWTVGGGYTISQGFRIGVSAAHGPYLHRGHRFFFQGEAPPKTLPATGYGVDVQWARGKFNVNGEIQRFQYPYRAIPYFFQTVGYGEVKWAILPRWYLAGRVGGRATSYSRDQSFEAVIAFRPAPRHLLKFGWLEHVNLVQAGVPGRVIGIQYVVSLDPPSLVAN